MPTENVELKITTLYGNQSELDDARSMGALRAALPKHVHMRRFVVYRPEPPEEYKREGLTNAGYVPDIEGIEFTDGTVSIRWMVQDRQSFANWKDFATFEAVHGHPEYGTRIVWLDA